MSLVATPGFWSPAAMGEPVHFYDCELQEWIIQVFFPGVEEVFLGGEFNRWTVPGLTMREVSPQVWEARIHLRSLTLPSLEEVIGCFGFVRGRLNQVRYFRTGEVTTDESGVRNDDADPKSRFQLLRDEII